MPPVCRLFPICVRTRITRSTYVCRLAAGSGHESCLAVLLAAAGTAASAASADAAATSAQPSSPDNNYKASVLDAVDIGGSTAAHYACRAGEDGTLALLAGAGACLELPSRGYPDVCAGGVHPAHLAVAYGFLFCLEELAAHGVNLEAASEGDGETPLSLAVQVNV